MELRDQFVYLCNQVTACHNYDSCIIFWGLSVGSGDRLVIIPYCTVYFRTVLLYQYAVFIVSTNDWSHCKWIENLTPYNHFFSRVCVSARRKNWVSVLQPCSVRLYLAASVSSPRAVWWRNRKEVKLSGRTDGRRPAISKTSPTYEHASSTVLLLLLLADWHARQ